MILIIHFQSLPKTYLEFNIQIRFFIFFIERFIRLFKFSNDWSLYFLTKCFDAHQRPSIGLSSQWYLGQFIILTPNSSANFCNLVKVSNALWVATSALKLSNRMEELVALSGKSPSSFAIAKRSLLLPWSKHFIWFSTPFSLHSMVSYVKTSSSLVMNITIVSINLSVSGHLLGYRYREQRLDVLDQRILLKLLLRIAVGRGIIKIIKMIRIV